MLLAIKNTGMFGSIRYNQKNDEFKELLDYINEPATIVRLYKGLLIEDLNEQFGRLIGKGKHDVKNQDLLGFFTCDSQPLINKNFKVTGTEDDILEGILESADKKRIHVEIRVQQLSGDDLFLITYRDISHIRKVLKELKNHQNRIERTESIANIGYWEYDLKSNQISGSQGARAIYGLDGRHMDFEAIKKMPLPQFREELDNALFNLTNKGEKYDVEFEIINGKGKKVFIRSMAEYDGFEKKVYGIIQDVTSKKRFEQELVEAKNKAEESDKLKSAFLSNMSHEIRTPMNGILGFSKLLSQQNVSCETRLEYAQIVDTCCNRLLEIINDILDISKAETGQVKLEKTLVDPLEIFNEIGRDYKDTITNKGIELKINQPVLKIGEILTDRGKLKQIFKNLLDNSIRFTAKGYIEVGCSINDFFIEFYVKDTGIGIEQKHHQIVFEPFRQAEVSTSTEYGGFGTGLTIARKYVELLGGNILIESEIGIGTTIRFSHPINSRTDNENKQMNNKMKTMTCLVVEDYEINYLYLKALLAPMGVDVIWAKNGLEAIQFVKGSNQPDIVLMDIRLPDMDGYDVTRAIKKLSPQIPIIAQTANALVNEKEKAYMAGCDDYITKPIYKEELLSKIGNYVHN